MPGARMPGARMPAAPEPARRLLAPGDSVTVRVPATAANLGPGFDTLGLALSLWDELTVTVIKSGLEVVVDGVGAGEVPLDESNIVVHAIRHVLAHENVQVPGLRLEARNSIPHSRGMGSSGAAIVSGVLAASALIAGSLTNDDVAAVNDRLDLDGEKMLGYATELEGHPDNVAPALFGGLTIAWMSDTGPQYKKLLVHRGVSPLVLVPEFTMSTKVARSLQPANVPHEDAIFNVSRSALLVAALIQSPELLLAATEDRLHQSYRASAMPATHDLVSALRDAGFPAVVSGAGPSVLVLAPDPGQRLVAAELASRVTTSEWTPLMLAVDFKGATVVAHPGATTA